MFPNFISFNIRKETCTCAAEIIEQLDQLKPGLPKVIALQEVELWIDPELPDKWIYSLTTQLK